MQNYLLTLAYDGTNYCGFQVQPNGRSVAQTFQDGLEAVLHSRPDIKGCSRTDAGVHALGFALNFHAETRIPPEKLPLAINQHLPPDIRCCAPGWCRRSSTPAMPPIPRPTCTASTTTPSIRLLMKILHPGAPAAGCGCHAEGGGTVCGKARFSGPVRGGFLCCCPRRYRAHHHRLPCDPEGRRGGH